MVVGGFASIAHGVVRATMDLDLAIHVDDKDLKIAWDCLKNIGFVCRQPVQEEVFCNAQKLVEIMKQKNAKAMTFYHPDKPYLVVDLLMGPSFDPTNERKVCMTLFGVQVPVTTFEHLLDMKRAAGRPKDLEDIRELEMVKRRK